MNIIRVVVIIVSPGGHVRQVHEAAGADALLPVGAVDPELRAKTMNIYIYIYTYRSMLVVVDKPDDPLCLSRLWWVSQRG